MSGLSGFCSPAPGSSHDYSHTVCERRLKDGLLLRCGCPDHRETPAVERDSPPNTVESETKRGPDRANESDPLATVSTRPKGA